MNICLDPDKVNLINSTLSNTFILGQSGHGRAFYFDKSKINLDQSKEDLDKKEEN